MRDMTVLKKTEVFTRNYNEEKNYCFCFYYIGKAFDKVLRNKKKFLVATGDAQIM